MASYTLVKIVVQVGIQTSSSSLGSTAPLYLVDSNRDVNTVRLVLSIDGLPLVGNFRWISLPNLTAAAAIKYHFDSDS